MFRILEELQQDRKAVFNLIQKQGPLSKQNIQFITNLKLTTLNRIIGDLQARELIIEDSLGESTGGRKPTLYNINSSRFYIIGVDISRTYTQIVFVNLKMQILRENKFLMDESYSSERTLDKIIEAIYTLLHDLKISRNQVLGVGIGTVGPLDREKGVLLTPANFIGDNWQNVSIKDILKNKLNLPIIIDNGANSAVLGEYFYGSGNGFKNIAYINCGVGIRTGVITSGKIIRTINDREDAFGHMVIDIDGEACYCGNYGCVECYSSIYAIIKRFKRELKKGKLSSIKKKLDDINYLDIFMAADKGDLLSREVVTNSALIFGTALANYINLLNPRLVILSGPTVYISEIFYEISMEAALKKINATNVNIKFSKGGNFKEHAIAIGAAAMVLENFLK
jgi:predicted NBD/HSP70 family sugar kinase